MTPPQVLWPPDEKVKLIGALSRPQVLGVGAAFGVFGFGIACKSEHHAPDRAEA